MLPFTTQLLYTPFYCEENVWHLTSHPHFAEQPNCKVVFISNHERQCWFWHQRNAPAQQPILWDYHVILLAADQIWDLDTTLPFPCDAQQYLDATFAHVGKVSPDTDPIFRLIDRDIFVSEFASDRSHMLDSLGHWMQPPPAWPVIHTQRATNNLQKFIDMHDTTFGAIYNLPQLKATL